MITLQSGTCALHVQLEGPEDGRVLMFSNSLGTDMRVWDPILPHLPAGLRVVRYDKRGHGLSDMADAPLTIDILAEDAIAIAEAFGLRDITFVGLSIGGLIGQCVAAMRPDLLRGLVLMDTAAKIGTAEIWQERIDALDVGGLEGMAEAILDRWFAPGMRSDVAAIAPWRNMVTRTPAAGYRACCEAIAAADFTESTRGLKMPIMAMAGAHDGATPPALVRATAALCGAEFHEIADAGHLPCVERSEETARLIKGFLEETANA